MPKAQLERLRELVNLPTAPFVETHVIRYIEDFVSQKPRLRLRRDRFGNLLVKYEPARKSKAKVRPVLFAAHMDHPGFVATKMLNGSRVQAQFLGWVQKSYFNKARIRFFSEGQWVPAIVEKVIVDSPRNRTARRADSSARSFGANAPPSGVIASVKTPVKPNSPGMWNIKDASFRGNRIYARVCDDIAGLAAIVSALDVICRKAPPVSCYAFFTRAEEVGFAGALAAVADETIPKRALVVAVECSKAITGVGMGDGPVLRVGDKASVFTPAATAYCQVVADQLAMTDSSFRYQRKLMDGGTCESTAYCHYGYDATGICLPLMNYHNMDTDGRKIAAESIDVRDYSNLVKWFVALAESPAKLKFDGTHPGLGRRLDSLLKRHRGRLTRTARN